MFLNQLAFVFSLCLAATVIHGSTDHERKPYIVYMGDLPEAGTSAVNDHHNLLVSAIGDENLARESKIHSYGRSFNGFAARLLPHEVQRLRDEESVVSVFANTRQNLHTTRSWDFLGLPMKLNKNTFEVENNIIVGLLDTGIFMGSPSFDDRGYGPAPSKWRGQCLKGANFTGCNNKVVGAKYYQLDNTDPNAEEPTPTDTDGHGTHTSSTVAGVPVKDASLYGIAKGTARGGASSARIAMYKVCWNNGCTDMDVLAGFDDAIADGVDLISVSLGGATRSYFEDPIAIGSFHAMKKGILTSSSCGNDGPSLVTVQNVAPWILTVAASGIDRQFKSAVTLGNGKQILGIAINTFAPKKQMYPLTNGDRASNMTGGMFGNASACDYGTLSMEKVKGRIVYCLGSSGQDYTLKDLGAAGTVMTEYEQMTDVAFIPLIPATFIPEEAGINIDKYINSTKDPKAVIQKTRAVNTTAPFVASFSSRGPQTLSLNILKPDIAAPGLNILAAYSKVPSITSDPTDKRHSKFNILSGTSMACPHAAAAAAYVKSVHPDWSAAAIKSAIMTTATPMKVKTADAELGYGSGQINPAKAAHPGLIYDISLSSYIRFLCKEGYNSTTIGLLLGGKQKYECSNFKPAEGIDGLNYPSMHMQLNSSSSSISAKFYRTVTNVGNRSSVYKSIVTFPKGLSVQVVPNTLSFKGMSHEKRSFKVMVKGSPMPEGTQILSALLEWTDSKHSVKSPIVIYRSLYA